MVSRVTFFLTIATTIVLGLLAGAVFSRHAHFGNGMVIYLLVSVGATLLALASALSIRRQIDRSHDAELPIYLTALISWCALLLTTCALTHPVSLAGSMWFWGTVRASLQLTAFATSVWGLVKLCTADGVIPATDALPPEQCSQIIGTVAVESTTGTTQL